MTASLAILAVALLGAVLWLLIVATIRLDAALDEISVLRQRVDDLERRWPR